MNNNEELIKALMCIRPEGSENCVNEECPYNLPTVHTCNDFQMMTNAADALEALQIENATLKEAARWIPITEKQPKSEDATNGMIEVWDNYGPDTMSVDFYWEFETSVTHWRRLPEPPKGEQVNA